MSNIIDSIQVSGVTYAISGGSGGNYSAGRGISIDSANTISLNVPISAGTGTNSIREGHSGNTASGNYSHAEGRQTSATSSYSHAEGYSTSADGYNSHAEGSMTRASGGYGAHAEGANTIASGSTSHAEGGFTVAGGIFSHAEGENTIANNESEHASGKYNISLSEVPGATGHSGNTLFSVGNGTADNARHNAFEIRQNADIYIVSGGTDIKLQDHLGGGGNATVELTQAEYDALVSAGTVSANTYYIITDAQAGDLTQYWTSAQTQSAITSAVSTKQDTLVSGTNIKTINNESILGSGNIDIQGGGKAIEAGRGISITTGETADTVSLGFPIWNGGSFNSCVKVCSETNNISGSYSFASGTQTKVQNRGEFASGCYNTSNYSNSTFGNSGNTLFSVGNGTSTNARHNAFEIRQNGDIYLTKDGQDVKLQDQLGGGSITVDTALDSGSTNPVENRVIYNKIDEVEQVTAAALNNINDRLSEDEEVTAAGLNAVNDKFGGLKLQQITQSAYDALVTKDASTLYIIVN